MTVNQKLVMILSGHDVANGRTDRRTDRQTDGRTNAIPWIRPFLFGPIKSVRIYRITFKQRKLSGYCVKPLLCTQCTGRNRKYSKHACGITNTSLYNGKKLTFYKRWKSTYTFVLFVLYENTKIQLTSCQEVRVRCLSRGRNAKQCCYKTIQDKLLVN